MPPACRYGSDYRELVHLPSGIDIVCRAVRPDDKRLLAEGMERLSPVTRFARFLSDKDSLSESELTYLTELDGVDHYAIGAVRPLAGGGEAGIGVARFVRLRREPEVAEPAVTVIDDFQGCGVGTALLRRLVDAARERGIKRFRCEFLADNRRVRSILDEFRKNAIVHHERGIVTMEFPLPTFGEDEAPRATLKRSALYRALVRAAQGRLSLRRVHRRDGTREPTRDDDLDCDRSFPAPDSPNPGNSQNDPKDEGQAFTEAGHPKPEAN
jgi:GNAT superfamily N-acetyltransferase